MRRLVGFVLMATLIAPAIAVCAGSMPSGRPASEHDCCPRDLASLSAPEAPAPDATCCRMSSDAARRGAIPSHELVLPSTPAETAADWLADGSEGLALGGRVTPAASPHIARHLLLSVLLI